MSKRKDQGPDLFDWGAAQAVAAAPAVPADAALKIEVSPEEPKPVAAERKIASSDSNQTAPASKTGRSDPEPVIDFRVRRETLPRFILHPLRELDCMDRWIDRKAGKLPPAPIIAFARPRPAPEPIGPPEPGRSSARR